MEPSKSSFKKFYHVCFKKEMHPTFILVPSLPWAEATTDPEGLLDTVDVHEAVIEVALISTDKILNEAMELGAAIRPPPSSPRLCAAHVFSCNNSHILVLILISSFENIYHCRRQI